MVNSNWTQIGKILKTKGFDGTTIVGLDLPMHDATFKACFIQKNNQYSPLLIESMTEVDDFTLHIRWKNYASKELAQSICNRELYLDSDLVEKYFDIEEDEDYIGFEVYNFEEKIGEVVDILENNFQETIEVKISENKHLLIPFIDEFIETIDEDKKIIYCNLSPEFIEMFSN
jgi:16S rRNA processing protein RimM